MGEGPQGPWAGAVLGPYTGSSVSTRDPWSPHGILGPHTGSLVPAWDVWSLHEMLSPRTGSSVPTWDARSPHGILGPHTGSLVPAWDARSLHGKCLVSAVNSAGTHAPQGVSALKEPCVVSGVHRDTPGGFKQQDLPSQPELESNTKGLRGCAPSELPGEARLPLSLPLGHWPTPVCGRVLPPSLVSEGTGLRARLDDQHPSLHLQRCFSQVRSCPQVLGSRGVVSLGPVFVPRPSQVGGLSGGSL